MEKKVIELFGMKFTIEKDRKEKIVPKLSDDALANRAMDKYLGGMTTFSGLCGDVETCRVIGFKEVREGLHEREVVFYTDSKDYDKVYWKENEIMKEEKENPLSIKSVYNIWKGDR